MEDNGNPRDVLVGARKYLLKTYATQRHDSYQYRWVDRDALEAFVVLTRLMSEYFMTAEEAKAWNERVH